MKWYGSPKTTAFKYGYYVCPVLRSKRAMSSVSPKRSTDTCWSLAQPGSQDCTTSSPMLPSFSPLIKSCFVSASCLPNLEEDQGPLVTRNNLFSFLSTRVASLREREYAARRAILRKTSGQKWHHSWLWHKWRYARNPWDAQPQAPLDCWERKPKPTTIN